MFVYTTQDATGVPVGAYQGVFEGVEAVPPNEEKGYGPAHKFTWAITTGEHAGRKASRIIGGKRPNPKNGLGKMLVAIKGGALTDGEGFDPKAFQGRPYTVIVGQTQSGGTRVETVAPIAA